MKREEIRVCIIRVGGTNCDAETSRAFQNSGMNAEVVHFSQLGKKKRLLDYHVLAIPGGFSHGDYVRAGAIWANQLMTRLGKEIKEFVDDERPILGICNGFQVLIEAGLLPGFDGISLLPEAALGTNVPSGYCCRWIYVRHEKTRNCVFTTAIPTGAVLRIPIAHSEGRFLLAKKKETSHLERLLNNDQLVFRYCHADGEYAKDRYPANPNGSFYDIAGICDSSGTIFGLMPHPERAYYGWQLPDWTKKERSLPFADGKLIFDSVAEYIEKKF